MKNTTKPLLDCKHIEKDAERNIWNCRKKHKNCEKCKEYLSINQLKLF